MEQSLWEIRLRMMKTTNKEISYCGFGKSLFIKPPFWSFQNASCKIHDENYKEGGNKEDRLTSDAGFLWRMLQDANKQKCMSCKKKAIYSAILYFLLVRIFGWISFRWKR